MKIDLHVHSHVSDGDLSPAALVAAASAAGLDLIALTDHDTAAGVPAALSAAAGSPLRVSPGIEISTRLVPHELHILGYWIDPESAPIVEHQTASVHRRVDRMERMVESLQRLGIEVSYDDVARAAGPEVRSIGRPHLARALLAGGHTRYYGEAFARFISDSGPAFVAQDFPTPAEAIATIHAAGGVAVWAHPPLDIVEPLLPDFAGWGLDGLECFRPSLARDDMERLRGLARSAGLFPTGGSDWHGPHRGGLGEFSITEADVPELLAADPALRPVDRGAGR
jgi:predicted metal-dependent phosphoesterase TrpH